MSQSSKKGLSLERSVAKLLRSKLSMPVERDPRSGAGDVTLADIKDYSGSLRWAIECKNQATLKLREWWKQATQNTRLHQQPAVVFKLEHDVLVAVRLGDLVNLEAEIKQLQEQRDELTRPIATTTPIPGPELGPATHKTSLAMEAMQAAADAGAETCRAGHPVVDEHGHCQWKGCQYSRGYRPSKKRAA